MKRRLTIQQQHMGQSVIAVQGPPLKNFISTFFYKKRVILLSFFYFSTHPQKNIKKSQMIYKPGFVIDNHSSGSFITKTL